MGVVNAKSISHNVVLLQLHNLVLDHDTFRLELD